MTAVKFAGVTTHNDANVRKALTGGVFIGASTVTAPTLSTLFDATTGDLNVLPTGFHDMGYLSTDGAKFSRAVKEAEIDAWGTTAPVRTDATSDVGTVAFTALETNIHTVAAWTNVAESTLATSPGANGAFAIPKPTLPTPINYRLLVIGVDETGTAETIIARFFPNARITDYADQSFANGDDPVEYGFTFTAYPDDTLGYTECAFYGGAGWLANITTAGMAHA